MSETNLDLMHHLLGSIDLSDLDIVEVAGEEEMNEGERKDYCATISAVFPRLEKDIKRAMYKQLLLTFSTADNMDKVALGQGTFNGMSLLLDKWRIAHVEHTSKIVPKEEMDKHNPVPEI
jgi:hypothetical protein